MIVRYLYCFQTVAGELYGPVMVVMTLVALLLFSMKHSGHTVVSTICQSCLWKLHSYLFLQEEPCSAQFCTFIPTKHLSVQSQQKKH